MAFLLPQEIAATIKFPDPVIVVKPRAIVVELASPVVPVPWANSIVFVPPVGSVVNVKSGETTRLPDASVESSRKWYKVLAESPESTTECAVTRVGSGTVLEVYGVAVP